MAVQKWTLTDVGQSLNIDQWETEVEMKVEGLPSLKGSIRKYTLRGGRQEGVEVVEVDNGRCRFAVLCTRGMGVWRAEQNGITFGWAAPAATPVHPRHVPLYDPSGIGWLDGFSEMLVRCGLENNGAPQFCDKGILEYPLHGAIANLPAETVEVTFDDQTGAITVVGTIRESRLFFKNLKLQTVYRTSLGGNGFDVDDTVTNLSAQPGEFQLLYHVNFGPPLVEPSGEVILAHETVSPRDAEAARCADNWNRIDPETPGSSEVCYYFQPSKAAGDGMIRSMLHNADATLGVSLDYRPESLPCFTLWKSRLDRRDGYVVGLEPGTNYPNTRSYEKQNGRVVQLTPEASREMNLSLRFHTNAVEVVEARDVAESQCDVSPMRLIDQPMSGLSPAGK